MSNLRVTLRMVESLTSFSNNEKLSHSNMDALRTRELIWLGDDGKFRVSQSGSLVLSAFRRGREVGAQGVTQ